MENIPAPEVEKKKELKVYSFTRIINSKNIKEATTEKDGPNNEESTFNFKLNLLQNEISIIAKKDTKNEKLANISYEQYISLKTLQSFNKFFSILDTEKIFVIIQKSFEQSLDNITLEEDKIVINLMVNFMEVVTEKLKFELQMIKLTNEEETDIRYY